ncbi:MAG: hypothetical protein WDM70_04770 [Nitrosomonadales bacterium]
MRKFLDSRPVYTVLLWLLFPYIFFHLLWRARKQPEYLDPYCRALRVLCHIQQQAGDLAPHGFQSAKHARLPVW